MNTFPNFYKDTIILFLRFMNILYLQNWYTVIQLLCTHTDGCRSRPWLARWPVSRPSYWRCFQTLTLLFQVIFRVDGHAHRGHLQSRNVSVYWLWLLLEVSAINVVIVIIAICDMPREFSLCEHVYIHNMYMKSRESCSETRHKFWESFQDDLCLIPVLLGNGLKDSKKQAP